jgi:rRNA maturation endonuclease Nob1
MENESNTVKKIPSLLAFGITELTIEPEKHYWNFCVNCGTQMDSRKCKLFCPVCGFYHNCSEP